MRVLLSIVVLLLALAAAAAPQSRPQLAAVRAASPPAIDGALDDACWAGAATFTDFTLRVLQKPLQFATTAYLCYDDACLYAAVRADDPEPQRIVAQETRRNGYLSLDDVVQVAVDPTHQFQSYFSFSVNPRGAQNEEIPGGSSSNITWRGDWKAAAKRTPTGWTAEFAIPWRVLHPPRKTTAMGVYFGRKVARIDDWALSPNLGPRWDARLMADWTGLDIPDVSRPPVFLTYQQLVLRDGRQVLGAGLDVKQESNSRHNWLVTLNPDFESVEGAVEGISFSYNERWVPDYRPFFTEGRSYYPGDRIFYSPRVEDVEVAAKSYSPGIGRFAYATLATLGAHGNQNVVAAMGYRFRDKPRRSMYTNLTYHHEPGIINQVFDVGGSMEFPGKGGRAGASAAFSTTGTQGADGDGTFASGSLSYSADTGRISYGGSFSRVGRFFNPMLGYVPEKNYLSFSTWAAYSRRYARGPVEILEVDGGAGRSDRLDGTRFQDWRDLYTWIDLRPNTWLSLGASEGYRNPHQDNDVSFGFGWGRRSLYRSGSIYCSFGHTDGGVSRYISVGNSFRPWRNFGLYLSLAHSRVDYPPERGEEDYERSQLILSLSYDISAERSLGGRWVAGAPDFGALLGRKATNNFYLTYRQAVRRGVDAYAIVGDPSADKWAPRFALKLMTPF